MNVLSLFDGMSCGRIALERAGIKVKNYYSSEIDKYAIKVANKNYPQDEKNRLGNVLELDLEYLKSLNIDLLIGGSPCQGFSFAGKQKGSSTKCGIEVTTLEHYLLLKKEGFEFEGQSYLFWEYIRILNAIKPKYFLLENVKMSKKWLPMFNSALGVSPLLINSALVSAQIRERLYWTNIKNIKTIIDKKIKLKNIVQEEVDEQYFLSEKAIKYIIDAIRIKKKYTAINGDKSICLMSQYNQSKNGTFLCVDANGRIDENKTGTLPQRYYKCVEKFGSSPFLYNGRFRKFTPKECERLQTVDDDYTNCVSDTQRYKMLGNGWTVDVITHIFKGLR